MVLAVAAVVLGAISWRDSRRIPEGKRRFDCPADVGSRLPSSDGPSPATAPAAVDLTEVLRFNRPVGMATRHGDDALYFVEKGGRVMRAEGATTAVVLDLAKEVSTKWEQGLLGLAFSPDGSKAYTNHTDLNGDTRVTEWTVGEQGFGHRRQVFFVDQPYEWHNGGSLVFGPKVDRLTSFGVDQAGELYAMSLDGDVFKVVPSPPAARP